METIGTFGLAPWIVDLSYSRPFLRFLIYLLFMVYIITITISLHLTPSFSAQNKVIYDVAFVPIHTENGHRGTITGEGDES